MGRVAGGFLTLLGDPRGRRLEFWLMREVDFFRFGHRALRVEDCCLFCFSRWEIVHCTENLRFEGVYRVLGIGDLEIWWNNERCGQILTKKFQEKPKIHLGELKKEQKSFTNHIWLHEMIMKRIFFYRLMNFYSWKHICLYSGLCWHSSKNYSIFCNNFCIYCVPDDFRNVDTPSSNRMSWFLRFLLY